jgi:hypothetical protein
MPCHRAMVLPVNMPTVLGVLKNLKFQITNRKYQTNHNDRSASGGPNLHIILRKENFKYVWVIEYWNLRFVCNLVLGVWDFITPPDSCLLTPDS